MNSVLRPKYEIGWTHFLTQLKYPLTAFFNLNFCKNALNHYFFADFISLNSLILRPQINIFSNLRTKNPLIIKSLWGEESNLHFMAENLYDCYSVLERYTIYFSYQQVNGYFVLSGVIYKKKKKSTNMYEKGFFHFSFPT